MLLFSLLRTSFLFHVHFCSWHYNTFTLTFTCKRIFTKWYSLLYLFPFNVFIFLSVLFIHDIRLLFGKIYDVTYMWYASTASTAGIINAFSDVFDQNMSDFFKSAFGLISGSNPVKEDCDFVGQIVEFGNQKLRVKRKIAEGVLLPLNELILSLMLMFDSSQNTSINQL